MWRVWGRGEEECIQGCGGGDLRPLGRTSHRWEDNSKINLREVGCGGVDWIDVAQDRGRCGARVNAVMNRRVP
jgi:hypothetical protein